MIARRMFMKAAGLGLAAAAAFGPTGLAAQTITVGEINSYTRLPAFTEPYKKGWQLALEQINEAGGIGGKTLEVISRDDGGEPGNAVKIAEELVTRDEVVMLAGGFFSNVGLALADYAKQRKVLFLASEPLTDALVWSKGNRYTFRLRPSTYMQAAMLAEKAGELDATKWATISPNYAYGKDAVTAFKEVLKERKADVEFVEEQWPPLFKIDAGSTARALEAAKPDAIYNVTFGPDLAKFVREGELRGLFEGREVVSLLSGEPEYLDPLGAEAPEGWIVTGYPWYALKDEGNKAFIDAYREKWGEPPMTGSLVGYNMMMSIATLLRQADSTDTETLVDTLEGLDVETPQGVITYRKADHQSTMGAWVGRTALKDGKGIMVDWYYADGADYLPSPEEAAKMRPAE
ncbi:ABC transporter substrate-binding protein [Kaustia mangrovi]|uniref:ABC transporter substrate-binding protein n=1 Tax=Kaustia mangrovi TaxID=2593653 RepID=A0A7S8C1K9_9HYPH|nr:ABC transporter substrate-binding protein [Kaustia mangrovi]QPC41705.1 ABC transporter substrate-binding protein [Kaustia mangrovi]